MNGSRAVLVTGASGFLGAWTLSRLIAHGKSFVATDLSDDRHRLDQLLPTADAPAVDWRTCDVTDGAAVAALVGEVQPEAIIHLAALQIPACTADPVMGANVNILGNINVFEAARAAGTRRVVYTSSIAAKPRGPANAPANFYGVFKKTGEEIARLYSELHGVHSMGIRPFIVYGVGRDDGETSALTKAMRAAATGERYTLPFRMRSSFEYAGEVGEILYRCSQAQFEGAHISDIATGTHTTDEVLEHIRRVAPDADIIAGDTERLAPSVPFDTEPLRQAIGDWPQTSLADGIGAAIAHYRRLLG